MPIGTLLGGKEGQGGLAGLAGPLSGMGMGLIGQAMNGVTGFLNDDEEEEGGFGSSLAKYKKRQEQNNLGKI